MQKSKLHKMKKAVTRLHRVTAFFFISHEKYFAIDRIIFLKLH